MSLIKKFRANWNVIVARSDDGDAALEAPCNLAAAMIKLPSVTEVCIHYIALFVFCVVTWFVTAFLLV